MLAAGIDPELLAAFREAVRAKIRRDLADEAARSQELRDRIVPLVRQAIETARAAGHCRRAWLYGSFAGGSWGQPGPRSDVDLLIEGDDETVARFVSRVASRELHVLALDRAPPSLVERAMAEGLPL